MSTNQNCPICNTAQTQSEPDHSGRDATRFRCRLCGNFTLTGSLIARLSSILEKDRDASTKISFSIRSNQGASDDGPELNTKTIASILERPLPGPVEQCDLLIRWLAQSAKDFGELIAVNPTEHRAIIGARSSEGFAFVLRHLYESGLLTGHIIEAMGAPGRGQVTLSFAGWQHANQLKLGQHSYRKAFMAMKFGEPDLDQIFNATFKPSAEAAGFQLFKLDENPRAGLIDDRLRVEIQASDFVVADLTHDNLGAYWEAGYAEGLGKPVIYTCERNRFEARKTHFDTNHHLTVAWDLAHPDLAGESLKATIRATFPHIARMKD